MFFCDLFRFRNERNPIPFILLPIGEWTDWPEYGSLRIRRICVLLGKFWPEMILGRLVTRRRLEICKNLNGIAIQNVYRRCGCVGLYSVSLPVVEQEELSVCFNKKKCPCLVKRNDVDINWFVEKPRTFFQIKSTSRRREYGNTFAVRKAVTSPKNVSSVFSKWSKPRIRQNRQKTGTYDHISTFRVPNFRETSFTLQANAVFACADTIVPRSPSLIVFRFQNMCSFVNWYSVYSVIPNPEWE